MSNCYFVKSGFGNEDIYYLQDVVSQMTVQVARAVKAEGGGYSRLYEPDTLYYAHHAEEFGERLSLSEVCRPEFFERFTGDFVSAVMVLEARIRAALFGEAASILSDIVRNRMPRPPSETGALCGLLPDLRQIVGLLARRACQQDDT